MENSPAIQPPKHAKQASAPDIGVGKPNWR
jgi:hypothetical protein